MPLIKVAYFMLNFLNLKSFLRHLFLGVASCLSTLCLAQLCGSPLRHAITAIPISDDGTKWYPMFLSTFLTNSTIFLLCWLLKVLYVSLKSLAILSIDPYLGPVGACISESAIMSMSSVCLSDRFCF